LQDIQSKYSTVSSIEDLFESGDNQHIIISVKETPVHNQI